MKLPRISIVTPSYNQGKFIEETISSVLSQDYPDIEYWVIDAGSSDSTLKVLKKYKDKIRFISEPDEGQSDAINKGLSRSTGDILAYLNSDDIYLPGALKRVGEHYNITKADWISGDYKVINSDGKVSHTSNIISAYKRILMKMYSPFLLKITDSMLPQPSTFWSRSAYEKVGSFNIKYNYVMDYDYWLRMSRIFSPSIIPAKLSGFRIHSDSKSESGRRKLMQESITALSENGASNLEIALHKLHNLATALAYKILG